MRDHSRLEIAAFERLQRVNWTPPIRLPSDEEIDARLEPVWQDLLVSARYTSLTLEPPHIAVLNRTIAEALGADAPVGFLRPESWLDFLRVVHATHIREMPPIRDIAARLIARLHWHHLSEFSLLTAWMHVSALSVQQGGEPLVLRAPGRLLRDLSSAGPPHVDTRPLHATLYHEDDYVETFGNPSAMRPSSVFSEKSPPS
jgi:hypothetical protein